MTRSYRYAGIVAVFTLVLSASGSASGSADGASRPNPAVSSSQSRHAHAAAPAFDFYLLTLSWSPEFCLTHHAAECAAHPGFVLHGLWPQRATAGPFLENCSNAPGPADPSQYADIFPDAGLLAHEWKTHGTCSGLSPDAYFSLARKAVQSVTVPQPFRTATPPVSLTPQDLLGQLGQANTEPAEDFAVSCGNNRLTAVQACFTRDLKPMSCASVKSCHANSIKITPPGATR